MVAISLYRGDLHRVPNVPRTWLMPTRRISLKDFRLLTHRRDKILSQVTSITAGLTSLPNHNPNFNPSPNPNFCSEPRGEGVGDNGCSKQEHIPTSETLPPPQFQQANNNSPKETQELQHTTDIDSQGQLESNGDTRIEQPKEVDELVLSSDNKAALQDSDSGLKKEGNDGTSQALQEKLLVSAQPTVNVTENVDLSSEKEKKKRELEEKLQVLNGRKHNLVQMLKLILNAEEEMKRRNSMPASAIRPPAPLQVETTSDLGSSPRHTVTRVGSEANLCGDLEGESEDHSTHNTHVRHFQRMRSTSPSASSPRRKNAHNLLQPNTVLYPPRAGGHIQNASSMLVGSGVIASPSPSRFAPSGSQPQVGHPANILPPPVSVSGTQFMASSPSPAASGGTSVFRDSRLTSPS